MNKQIEKINFQANTDDRGNLVILEETKTIPFSPKRMFYIYGVNDNKTRGNHANINSEFVMVALQGSVAVMIDNGKDKKEFILDNPTNGLYVPNLTWKTMYNFENNAILLVIASTLYDKNEYINDYNEFLNYLNKEQED